MFKETISLNLPFNIADFILFNPDEKEQIIIIFNLSFDTQTCFCHLKDLLCLIRPRYGCLFKLILYINIYSFLSLHIKVKTVTR